MKYIILIALSALSLISQAQNTTMFVRNAPLVKGPIYDLLVFNNGLRWVFSETNEENRITTLVIQDYAKVFDKKSTERPSAITKYFYFPNNFMVSPNMEYIVGNRVVPEMGGISGSKAKKFISEIRHFSDSLRSDNVTYPLASFEDKHYVLGVTDKGQMVCTEANTTKDLDGGGNRVQVATKYTNLYLLNPKTGTTIPLYKGKIYERQKSGEKQPNLVMNLDNTMLALPVNLQKKLLLVDLVSHKSTMIDLPEKIGETYIDYRFAYPFFTDDQKVLCFVSRTFQFNPSMSGRIIMGYDASSKTHRFAQNFPEEKGKYQEEFAWMNNTLYHYRQKEIWSYHFENNNFKPAEIYKLDSIGLNLYHKEWYFKQLMQTPEGVRLALVPRGPVVDTHTPIYIMNMATGRAEYEIMMYERLMSLKSAMASGANITGVSISGDKCSEKKADAQNHFLDIIMGWDGQDRYILDFDCKTNQYIVARLIHEEFVGEPGNFRKEPYRYILPEFMKVDDYKLRTKTKTGLKLCPECNGYPIGTYTTSTTSWTWKPVLGITWAVQSDVTTKTKHTVVCSHCQGQSLIK